MVVLQLEMDKHQTREVSEVEAQRLVTGKYLTKVL